MGARGAFAVLGFVVWATPVLAVDGVVEINQSCAFQSGCFAGDMPNYPITITGAAGRSYRLTSDLVAPNETTDGIVIETSRVTIDLNGFSIIGAVTGTGSGKAVSSGTQSSTVAAHATIRNGAIRGWSSGAIRLPLALGVRVQGLVIETNQGNGIRLGAEAQVLGNRLDRGSATSPFGISVGDRSRVAENVVSAMETIGVVCGNACLVTGNTVVGSLAEGMSVGVGVTIAGNAVQDSGEEGVVAGNDALVSNNTVSGNGQEGIVVGEASRVADNQISRNGNAGILCGLGSLVSGNTVRDNGTDGIDAANRSSVLGNVVSNNAGWALELTGTSTTYRGNTLWALGGAGAVTGGIDLGANACDGSTTCP